MSQNFNAPYVPFPLTIAVESSSLGYAETKKHLEGKTVGQVWTMPWSSWAHVVAKRLGMKIRTHRSGHLIWVTRTQ